MASNTPTTDPKNFTEENKNFFNSQAGAYEHYAARQKIVQIIGEDIIKSQEWSGIAWDEDSTRMLDYACGTGLITRVLAPYTKQIIGMDLSEGMVEQFNQSAENQGIPKDEMRAIVANICGDEVDPTLSDHEYYDFDVAISTLAFHHFENVPLAINRIAERLKPKTGVLLIIDFRTHEEVRFRGHHDHDHDQHLHNHNQHEHSHVQKDGNNDDHGGVGGSFNGNHTVVRNGFSEDEIKCLYEGAGLVDIDIVDVGPGVGMSIVGRDPKTGEIKKIQRSVFMAKGRRA